MLRNNLKLTKYQYMGLLLEVVTLEALRQLGISPIPLHNPTDNDYAKDQHLSVDLIFIHNGLLFGVECKNLSSRSHINTEFVQNEIIARFETANLPFYKMIVIFGKCNYQTAIPKEFDVIELEYQVTSNNSDFSVKILKELLRAQLFQDTPCSNNNTVDCRNSLKELYSLRKPNWYSTNQLSKIDNKLLEEWKSKKEK